MIHWIVFFLFILLTHAGAGEIHDAATQGQVERVRALLDGDPKQASAPGPNELGPLHLACMYRHEAVAELLIARGADDRGARPSTAAGYRRPYN